MDWAAFVTITVTSFPRLQSIDIWIVKESEQEAAYMKHAHNHLELLSQEHGIRLDVREPPWMQSRRARRKAIAIAEVDTATVTPDPSANSSYPSPPSVPVSLTASQGRLAHA